MVTTPSGVLLSPTELILSKDESATGLDCTMNDGIRYQLVDENGQPTTITPGKRPIVYYRDSTGYGATRVHVTMAKEQLSITFPAMTLMTPESFWPTPLHPDGFITQSRATSTMYVGMYDSDGTHTTHIPVKTAYTCHRKWRVGLFDAPNKRVRITVLCDCTDAAKSGVTDRSHCILDETSPPQ
jgi:hypothetical protein